ncbi:phosphoserine phosphatase SerB [Shewanella sp. NIFS-20-20]|uniref:phosphoserine phosphatase SerB n=1 Tax=Shewanella sp. NIFS-20-20 TaxID=2853806 RepID=UPI001C468067|nr:phosphoserine phosphatase SerB [Shewanella sp. NIFS-20-20]MBV7314935.1 phosphoserine phosphatase SerB [Shewanella sp. NIFS-20-20]
MEVAPTISQKSAAFDVFLGQIQSQLPRINRHCEGTLLPCVRWVFPHDWFADTAVISRLVGELQSSSCLSIAYLERPGDYAGIELAGDDLSALQSILSAWPGTETLAVSQPLPQLTQAGLLVMDMDSTAIQIECIDELASMAGIGAQVAEVTERAMQGELDFEQSLRLRVSLLAGARAEIIDALCQQLPLTPGLTLLCQTLQANGWKLVLASGGFTPFVQYLQQALQLDAAFANQLEIIAGKLTGHVTGDIVDAQCKAQVLLRCATQWHIASGQRLAIGDGANDIPMLMASDFGIAFHAKPALNAIASAKIGILDLQTLLFWLRK